MVGLLGHHVGSRWSEIRMLGTSWAAPVARAGHHLHQGWGLKQRQGNGGRACPRAGWQVQRKSRGTGRIHAADHTHTPLTGACTSRTQTVHTCSAQGVSTQISIGSRHTPEDRLTRLTQSTLRTQSHRRPGAGTRRTGNVPTAWHCSEKKTT